MAERSVDTKEGWRGHCQKLGQELDQPLGQEPRMNPGHQPLHKHQQQSYDEGSGPRVKEELGEKTAQVKGKALRMQHRVQEIVRSKPEKLELFVKPQVIRNQQPEKKKNTQPENQWRDFSHSAKLRKSFAF